MTYTLISHAGALYYVEGDVERHQLSESASIIEDGIRSAELPDESPTYCLLDLPQGVLANERDLDDEAACRADYQMDQERDDRLTGDL